jgi:hypothetical protein
VVDEPQASRPKAKAKSAARRKAPAKPNMTVALINETGSPQVAEDYRSVLSQMGYRVVSVQDRPPQGLAKETVISYRGESRGQAQALAQRLPGKRIMQPTSESLPAGAVVIVR